MRLLALAVSTLLALGLLWAGLAWIDARRAPPLRVRISTPTITPRAEPLADLAAVPGQEREPARPEDWAFHMTREEAAQFWVIGEDGSAYEPWSFIRARNLGELRMPWPEHPAGEIVSRWNLSGLREDREIADIQGDLRVLVAGDSHTEGVCTNSENFTHRLESALGARHPGRTVAVLNAGAGGQTILNYAGTWFRFREFRPQVFVVVIFGGNDLVELHGLHLYFTGRPWPTADEARPMRRARAASVEPAAMGQGLSSLEEFRAFPEEIEPTLRSARHLCREMRRHAEAAGARLVLVYLPSPFELDWPGGWPTGEKSRRILPIEAADLERGRQMAESLVSGLRADGATVLDLRAVFRAEPSPPYWREDLHLSLRGHEIVAAELLPLVDAALAAR